MLVWITNIYTIVDTSEFQEWNPQNPCESHKKWCSNFNSLSSNKTYVNLKKFFFTCHEYCRYWTSMWHSTCWFIQQYLSKVKLWKNYITNLHKYSIAILKTNVSMATNVSRYIIAWNLEHVIHMLLRYCYQHIHIHTWKWSFGWHHVFH